MASVPNNLSYWLNNLSLGLLLKNSKNGFKSLNNQKKATNEVACAHLFVSLQGKL